MSGNLDVWLEAGGLVFLCFAIFEKAAQPLTEGSIVASDKSLKEIIFVREKIEQSCWKWNWKRKIYFLQRRLYRAMVWPHKTKEKLTRLGICDLSEPNSSQNLLRFSKIYICFWDRKVTQTSFNQEQFSNNVIASFTASSQNIAKNYIWRTAGNINCGKRERVRHCLHNVKSIYPNTFAPNTERRTMPRIKDLLFAGNWEAAKQNYLRVEARAKVQEFKPNHWVGRIACVFQLSS